MGEMTTYQEGYDFGTRFSNLASRYGLPDDIQGTWDRLKRMHEAGLVGFSSDDLRRRERDMNELTHKLVLWTEMMSAFHPEEMAV